MAYTANTTKISWRKTGESGTYVEIPYLMEVPELGVAAEKIDITTLGDKVKQYITGIKDMGELVFKFLYEKNANYLVLKGLEDAGNSADFQIEYPDGSTHSFTATASVKMDAGSINGALTFSATLSPSTDITVA